MGNIEATFCGHDHNNDYWGDHYGIKLHFGRKTGFGGYGPPPGMQRGARFIEFSSDASGSITMNTWIRQEDGTVIDQQPKVSHLNKEDYCCAMQPEEIAHIIKNGFSLRDELLF
jgi:hypothetical protein